MKPDNKNMVLAIVLSMLIVFGWQFFVLGPQQATQPIDPAKPPTAGGDVTIVAPTTALTREEALKASPRIPLENPRLKGSIALKGAKLDDLQLLEYRETINPRSPVITYLSPPGAPGALFAEHGWFAPANSNIKVPGFDTVWQAPEGAKLTPETPVTLTWDNGEGLIFKRTILIDQDYLFTVRQEIENKGAASMALTPFARVQRHGTPYIEGIWVLYEGPHGVLGGAEQRQHYSTLQESKDPIAVEAIGGWLGFTDKYWAVALIPDQKRAITGEYVHQKQADKDVYQTDYVAKEAVSVPPGGKASYESHVFAGAKVVGIVDKYHAALGIDKFDLLIDWGWFWYFTKPLFWLLDWLKTLTGNFGLAILITTVLVKLAFYPLQNKSYESMAKMKKLQPEMEKLKARFPNDRMAMQKEMMELYKREKVSPLAGCLPVLVQIPVFFALYKVIYTTIELRHAPFFGWIKDLSAADPTSLFNLFGLIPWQPPAFLILGAWPIIMGITMWLQMRLNPTPPDPVQATLFNWMPLIFTFMLASFPAGLVIYWAWNNILGLVQQSIIMKRQGAEINFFGNIRESLPFLKKLGI
jgi:YidC/Oxa1 family membrane protein insertase